MTVYLIRTVSGSEYRLILGGSCDRFEGRGSAGFVELEGLVGTAPIVRVGERYAFGGSGGVLTSVVESVEVA